jgi:hypothetical protein
MDELVVKSCRDGGLGSLAFFDNFLRAIVRPIALTGALSTC